VIFHSDHGAQYTSKTFAGLCAEWERHPVDWARSAPAPTTRWPSRSTPRSNARPCAAGAPGPTRRRGRREVFRWVTRYNTRRRHSWCGQQAPIIYEQQHVATLRSSRNRPPRVHYPGVRPPAEYQRVTTLKQISPERHVRFHGATVSDCGPHPLRMIWRASAKAARFPTATRSGRPDLPRRIRDRW